MLELISTNWAFRGLILLGIFALVALAAIIGLNVISRRQQVSRELAAIGGDGRTPTNETLTRQRTEGAWAKIVKQIERTGLSHDDIRRLAHHFAYRHAPEPLHDDAAAAFLLGVASALRRVDLQRGAKHRFGRRLLGARIRLRHAGTLTLSAPGAGP